MLAFLTGRPKKPGLPPGTVIYTGKQAPEVPVQLTRTIYSRAKYESESQEITGDHLIDVFEPITWFSVDGLHNTDILSMFGERFDLHPLLLEDIANVDQRPKVEEYDGCLFFTLRLVKFVSPSDWKGEHMALIVGDDWLITFLEEDVDRFEAVRNRIKGGKGIIRDKGTDYLAYALLDSLVDQMFLELEKLVEAIDQLETRLMDNTTSLDDHQVDINNLKKASLYFQRTFWPLRDIMNQLLKIENPLFNKKTQVFLRDVQDHVFQLIELTDLARERLSDLEGLYQTQINKRMNDIMKTLTIIGSIFIPLTFVAGIYGMNFQYMPELTWKIGYPIVWLVMIFIAVGLIAYFKIRRWF